MNSLLVGSINNFQQTLNGRELTTTATRSAVIRAREFASTISFPSFSYEKKY